MIDSEQKWRREIKQEEIKSIQNKISFSVIQALDP